MTGTPRGFSLSAMQGGPGQPPPGMPAFPGMNPMQAGGMAFPQAFPSFGGHAVQMPAGWGMPGQPGMMTTGMPGTDDGSGGHGVGPMRRGRGGFPQRMPGPYDRQRPRFGSQSGRLSPPRGMGGMMGMQAGMMPVGRGAMKFADAPGMQGAIGPQEAVQGRSVKSYQDLDAVAGGGGGELNY